MKLTEEQVEKITKKIFKNLVDKHLIELKAKDSQVLKKMHDVFMEDLRKETKLDAEVEKLIQEHSGELEGDSLDYRKMFNLVKHKLAKEKGIIL